MHTIQIKAKTVEYIQIKYNHYERLHFCLLPGNFCRQDITVPPRLLNILFISIPPQISTKSQNLLYTLEMDNHHAFKLLWLSIPSMEHFCYKSMLLISVKGIEHSGRELKNPLCTLAWKSKLLGTGKTAYHLT